LRRLANFDTPFLLSPLNEKTPESDRSLRETDFASIAGSTSQNLLHPTSLDSAGASTVLQLIDAQRSYSQPLLGSVGAEAEQLQDAVQLFVALGGGWWNSSFVPP
jgi:hypothetical protein